MKSRLFLFIGILSVLFALQINAAPFQGEVFKINKYAKEVICRSADLSQLQDGQKIYVCDENNKLVAELSITRFYTTIIEAKLISGNIDSLKIKMPVYTSPTQFESIKPIKTITYEQDFDYYWWDAEICYTTGNASITKPTKVIIPKLITLTGEGYDKPVKLDSEEVSTFSLDQLYITGLQLKDGNKTRLKQIDFSVSSLRIPEEKKDIEEKFGKKVLLLNYQNATQIRLLRKLTGAEPSAVNLEKAKIENDKDLPRILKEKPVMMQAENKEDYREFVVQMATIDKNHSKLRMASKQLTELALRIPYSQRQDIYNIYSRNDKYVGCCLNFLVPGLGSYIQQDYVGGTVALSGYLIGGSLLIAAAIAAVPTYTTTYDSYGYPTETAKSSQTSSVGLMVAGYIILGSAELFAAIRPFAYVNSWNKNLANMLRLQVASATYSPMNIASQSSSSFKTSEMTLRFPLMVERF